MADMSGKVRSEFDAATAVTLRNLADGAETGADTDVETGVALNTLTAAYWDNDEVPNGIIKLNTLVTATDAADGDETYTVIWEVDTDVGFGTAVEVERLVVTRGTTGYFERYVSSKYIEYMKAGALYIRVKVTKGGTTPSITYGCWMTYVDAI